MTTDAWKIHRIMYGPSVIENVIVYTVGVILGIAIGLSICNLIERIIFPVVTDFKISSYEKQGDYATFAGSFIKRRSCRLIVTNVYGHGDDNTKTLLYTYKNDHRMAQLTTGGHHWGPVTLHLNDGMVTKSISVESAHQCHPFWQQETVYWIQDLGAL